MECCSKVKVRGQLCDLGEQFCSLGDEFCGLGEQLCGLVEQFCGLGKQFCGLGSSSVALGAVLWPERLLERRKLESSDRKPRSNSRSQTGNLVLDVQRASVYLAPRQCASTPTSNACLNFRPCGSAKATPSNKYKYIYIYIYIYKAEHSRA